jgi:hypothetical protein
MEIDVESDDSGESEEVKNDRMLEDDEEIYLSSVPTKTLFKKAGNILSIIKERLMAKDASVRERLT